MLSSFRAQGTVPLEVVYDASSSTGDGGISTDRWLFGDGTDEYGSLGTYTFNHAGQYGIQPTISAAAGSVYIDTVSISVEPAFWVVDESLDEVYKLSLSGSVIQTLHTPTSQPRGVGFG